MDEPEFRAALGGRAGGRRDLAARRRAGAGAAAQPGPAAYGWPGELRLLLRSVAERRCRDPRDWPAGSPAAVRAAAGRPRRPCCGPWTGRTAASWERLALRLAVAARRSWASPTPSRPASWRRSSCRADAAGLSWLSRVARGLQAAQLLMTDPAPWRVATGADLVSDCERHGDRWATCLLAGVVGFAYAQVGQDEAADALAAAGGRGRRRGLHAPGAGGLGHRLRAGRSPSGPGTPARRPRRPRRPRCAAGRSGWARPARPGCSARGRRGGAQSSARTPASG